LTLILPAVAVAEANTVIGGNSDTWRAILDRGCVIVTPLDESTAIDLGTSVGSLVVRHVIREASHTEGDIVTEAPWQYPADSPPLLTL
jgi:fructose-1,6-bisphosphatase